MVATFIGVSQYFFQSYSQAYNFIAAQDHQPFFYVNWSM